MEIELRRVLYGAVRLFAETRALPCDYPDTAFEPSAHRAYVKTRVLPIPPERLYVDTGESRHLWLWLTSFYVRESRGEFRPLAHAEAFRALYGADHRFAVGVHSARVTRTASIRPPVHAGGWTFLPVELRLESFL